MLSHRVYLQFIQLVLPLLSLALSDGSIRGALVSQITATYPTLWCQPDSRQTLFEGQSGSTGISMQMPRLLRLISPTIFHLQTLNLILHEETQRFLIMYLPHHLRFPSTCPSS